ncbi:MAG: archaetidylserine decarboxylase [Parachlamydia sp.]|jgi:phosphatidylserine decarboxylase|nr:archaetidylserine decarboxylase [Parachlamydia sp.]
MSEIIYIDRKTGQKKKEKVYKGKALTLLYGQSWLSRTIRLLALPLVTKWPFFSSFYGRLQKRKASSKKILPFIKKFQVDSSEFLQPVEHYRCFNDFFIRQLKPEARPIASGSDVVVMPADGRYLFYSNIKTCDGFVVKGKKFDIASLVRDPLLAEEYVEGSMLIARLCPSDYHRFHFPLAGIPAETTLINGFFYSVNPIAIRQNLNIFTENKRTLCRLDTKGGTILYLEIGATNVGSIKQTYTPGMQYEKGAEKGYFEFGGSSLILLFPKQMIRFDDDLLEATRQGIEIYCCMGERMGCIIGDAG